ncbi:MAG: bifunctional methylenetetrahydrofolate dehydrogenase/methenyltetrahydrofolate cyclohydrolase FolD [Spirochaetes bacterium]|nr:bifunctional methylenetetrahydrofolate dehydrogenase/methenyltetrahydrofolate cyclohydrolase FolD [Spirochaetota bacterium]
MQAKIIDGKAVAERIRGELKVRAAEFEKKSGRKSGLAVVLVGADPASQVYVRNKIAGCEQAGINSLAHYLDADTTQDALEALIDKLNADKNVDGILVQLPLPKHLDERRVLSRVAVGKDVDGFHAENAGALMLGEDCLAACTPSGSIELIKSTGVDMAGKNAVVIGRSNIVGKPVALLLLRENCTVTICHSKTQNIAQIAKTADILVAAIGKKEFVTGDMIKPGAIVIDVGINRHEGKLYGDVNFEEAAKLASHITPVPGGVGPMTIVMLLSNTLKAAELSLKAGR